MGDGWFLASATAVAQVPYRIEKLFHNTEYNSEGAFLIDFYVKGEKVAVDIDDRIPLLNYEEHHHP